MCFAQPAVQVLLTFDGKLALLSKGYLLVLPDLQSDLKSPGVPGLLQVADGRLASPGVLRLPLKSFVVFCALTSTASIRRFQERISIEYTQVSE